MNRSFFKSFFAFAVLLCAESVQASPVEQLGDRYVINVEGMNLDGGESLVDLLMMCPEVLTLNGKDLIGNDLIAKFFGAYDLRIDNIDAGIDNRALLYNLKARDVERIMICQNSEVMKGCGGLKKVVDIYLRKGDNGTSGRIAASGDTYGCANAFASVLSQQNSLRLLAMAEGNYTRSRDDVNAVARTRREGAKLNAVWDISSNDNLEVDLSQTFRHYRTGSVYSPVYNRSAHIQTTYIRKLSKAGAAALASVNCIWMNDSWYDLNVDIETNTVARKNDEATAIPFAFVEFTSPFFSKNLWLTGGYEFGCVKHSGNSRIYDESYAIGDSYNYNDFYLQADWNTRYFGFSIGDRYRKLHYHIEKPGYNFGGFGLPHHTETRSRHMFNVSAFCRFNGRNTLKASIAQRYYNSEMGDFTVSWIHPDPYNRNPYNRAYVSEIRYTYSSADFILNILAQNHLQNFEYYYNSKTDKYLSFTHDNTKSLGATAFVHIGMLRLNAGFNVFWENMRWRGDYNEMGNNKYARFSRFYTLKLAPELSPGHGWRLSSTLIYQSHRKIEQLFDVPANLYAAARLSKEFGEHWLVECNYHDIAGQHMGNRAVTFGVIYYW